MIQEMTTTATQLDEVQRGSIFNPPAPLTMRKDRERFPHVRDLGDAALPGIVAIVLRAMIYRGQKANEEDAALTATNLMDELQADRDHLGTDSISLAEVWYAVRKAVLGQRGEMFGVNVATLYRAVTDYIRMEGSEAERVATTRKPSIPSPVETRIAAAAGEFGRKSRRESH